MAASGSPSDEATGGGAALSAFVGHGGRLRAAADAFPEARSPWIDLSTGVNPQPYAAPRATMAARARLPDPAELAELERVAAQAFGVDPAQVCATAGAEAGIRLLAATLDARRAAAVGPTYGGHAAAWRAVGAEVETVSSLASADGADVRVLVNPNNPDGRLTPPESILLAAKRRGWLVVDESFVEAAPELSVAAKATGRLIVLRSFGKFYGLPGVRLGFVVGEPELIGRLRARQGDWPVSAEAIAAGLAAYPDIDWAERARRRLSAQAATLDAALRASGFAIEGGTSLFRLARAADAPRRFERLARAGVLARPFAERPDLLRFGLPPAGARRRVEQALLESGR